MSVRSPTDVPLKVVVTVAEMARMVNLSRARFYQLMGTAFPMPVYDLESRRPLFTEEQQRQVIEVRRRNMGIDGKPILFYARSQQRMEVAPRATRPRSAVTSACQPAQHTELIHSLKALGLDVSSADVGRAVKACFPAGITNVDEGTLIRTVFQSLRRQNSPHSQAT